MRIEEFIKDREGELNRRVRVGLIGFGKTNRAVLRALKSTDAIISLRSQAPIDEADGLSTITGDGYLDGVYEDVLFLSPSVKRGLPQLKGVRAVVTSECEVFFTPSKCEPVPRIYAVTGSDGKSTTTMLAAAMLNATAVGNIGVPYSDVEGRAAYACELSSFNLAYFEPPSDAALITNITPNHLDWHGTFADYERAKQSVLHRAGRVILPHGLRHLARKDKPTTLFSLTHTRRELLSLGIEHAVYLDGGAIYYDGVRVLPISELSMREGHNILNFMAALGLSYPDAELERIRQVGRTATPLPHRTEPVHISLDGVSFINSSIDTSPTRTKTTLASLGTKVLLILGGRSKGLDPSVMLDEIGRYAGAVAIYGECRGELSDAISKAPRTRGVPLFVHESFYDAVRALNSIAKGGDTILLSPAATAYGEFLNYEKRGDAFRKIAREIRP